MTSRLGMASVVSSRSELALAEQRTGGAAIDLVNSSIYVPVPDWFDLPVGGIQQRAPSTALPTEVVVPPSLLSVQANPDPAFRGELIILSANGASAAAGRHIVRADFFVDLNGNGQPDGGEHLNSDLDSRGGWRVPIDTTDLVPGVYTILARVADDRESHSPIVTTTIEIIEPGSPPAELPGAINPSVDSRYQIVPHRNGDIQYEPEFYHVGPGKTDFWEIRPATGGGFRFTVTGPTDTVLGLYDRATGALIDFDTNNGPGENAEIVATLAAGTAYVVAIAGENGASGNYGLDVTGANQEVTATISVPPPFYEVGTPGAITTPYETYYYSVVVPNDATSLDVRLDPSAFLDGFVRVASSEHRTIRTAFLAEASFDDVIVDMPVMGGETIYITVTGYQGTTGTYNLELDFNPDDSGVPDELAPVPATTPLIPFPWGQAQVLGASIDVPGEFDYYLFHTRPSEGGDYVFETLGDLDTQIGIYRYLDPSFALFEFEDDDSGAGRNARVEATLAGGERYIVLVRAEGTTTGEYDLVVTSPRNIVEEIVPSGLSLTKSTSFIGFAQNYLYHQFRVVAPQGTTTVSIDSERSSHSSSDTLDVAIRVADANGQFLAWVDEAGPGENEHLATLPIDGGEIYYVTFYGATPALGDSRLHFDFDPDFSVQSGTEFPVNSTTIDEQRFPDVAMNSAGESVVAWIGVVEIDGPPFFGRDVFFQRFDASGLPVGPETRAHMPVDDTANRSAVGIDADGGFVIATTMSGQTFFRRFDPDGVPLHDPVDAGIPGGFSNVVAVQEDGAFVLVGNTPDALWGRLFDPSGNPLAIPLLLDGTADEIELASASADGLGNYLIAWNVYSQGSDVNDVYVLRLDSEGNPLPSGRHQFIPGEIRGRRFEDLNGNGVRDPGESGVAGVTVLLDANGNGLQDPGELTAVTDSEGFYLFTGVPEGFYQVLPIGGPSSGPTVLIDDFNRADSSELGPDWTEELGSFRIEDGRARLQATDPEGKSRAVYAPFNGASQTVVVDVDYDTSLGNRNVNARIYLAYADPQHYVSVMVQDNDAFDGEMGFYRVFFDYKDSTSSTSWPRMTGGPQFVDVAPFTTARILASYDPVSATMTVGIDRDFDGHYETLLTRGGIVPDGLGSKVAVGGAQDVAIDNFTVDTNWKVMPPVGVQPGEAFRAAPSQDVSSQRAPAIAAHSDGTFVVAFEGNDTDGTGRNIYAQRFDSSGMPSGPLARVNGIIDGDQTDPAVAILSQGKYLVSWTTMDSSGKGVAAQLFGADGMKLGPEFTLNEHEDDDQARVALSSNGAETYLAAWESNWQDTSVLGVFGRRLTLDPVLEAEIAVLDSAGDPEDRLIVFDTASPASFVQSDFDSVDATIQSVTIKNHGNRLLTVFNGPVRDLVSASRERIALIALFLNRSLTHGCFLTNAGGAARQ